MTAAFAPGDPVLVTVRTLYDVTKQRAVVASLPYRGENVTLIDVQFPEGAPVAVDLDDVEPEAT